MLRPFTNSLGGPFHNIDVSGNLLLSILDVQVCTFKQGAKSTPQATSLNKNFRTVIRCKGFKSLNNSFEVANWMTTIVQAAASTGVGLHVVIECIRSKIPDIVYGCRCSLVDRYIWIMLGYFIYDSVLIVMDGKATVRNAVLWHHTVLLVAVLPALLFLR